MEPLLCFPDPVSAELASALERTRRPWRAVARIEDARTAEPEDGWSGAVVDASQDPRAAFAFCREVRSGEAPLRPLLLVLGTGQLGDLQGQHEQFDDFCMAPLHPGEVESRLALLLRAATSSPGSALIEHGPLVLNLETYQAAVAGRVLDLTYMEYELLRFLAARPGKVFTRDTLLSRVWGYEYYGGARTVDVHVRRLRAKLGEEHAHLIDTVRSVGYRFGQGSWAP